MKKKKYLQHPLVISLLLSFITISCEGIENFIRTPTPYPTQTPTIKPSTTPTVTMTLPPTLSPTLEPTKPPSNMIEIMKWITVDPYEHFFSETNWLSDERGDTISGDESEGWTITEKDIKFSIYLGPMSTIKDDPDHISFELGLGTLDENGEALINNRKTITTSRGAIFAMMVRGAKLRNIIYAPHLNKFVTIPKAFKWDVVPENTSFLIFVNSSNIQIPGGYGYRKFDKSTWCSFNDPAWPFWEQSKDLSYGVYIEEELFVWGMGDDGNINCPFFQID